ncbi:UNKNOWN [Stylonychia lemnae]|uniref:Uncharacterized protein n=1 Tax=Stylonychia lemnae TaxID=5949 RepID=A0A078B6I0_STYLE|nr:UNKNOWN [Stylonychia lemnae]|eukprot:CDW88882.1 UNKNOWN [Stylonychia lemnae]
MQYNQDIENSSDFQNFKDCRPNTIQNQNSSLLSNTTLAESNHNYSSYKGNKSAKSINNTSKSHKQTLAIDKSQQLKDKTKKQLIDQHQKYSSKVMQAANTVRDGNTIFKTAGSQQSQGYGQGGGIIKTVIMPNEEINRLGVEAEELRQTLGVSRQLFEEAIQGYHKDRIIREQEFKLKEQDFHEKIENLKRRVAERQEINYHLNKDYFAYKHVINKSKQKLQDDYDLLKVENQALKSQLDKIIDVTDNDTQYASTLFSSKTSNFAQRFRKASKENEEDLNIVKIQYSQVQDKYLSDLQSMERNLNQVIDKSKLIVSRRATESNAFNGDVQTLKKKVKNYEAYIKTLKDLVDQEKTQELVNILQKDDKVACDDGSDITLGQLHSEVSRIELEVREAKKYNVNAV